MVGVRSYSTIGIEGFISSPSDYQPSSHAESHLSPSLPSCEIVGVIKDIPDDFIVREILPKDNEMISKIISRSKNTLETPGDQLRIANMHSMPTIVLPSDCNQSKEAKKDHVDRRTGKERRQTNGPLDGEMYVSYPTEESVVATTQGGTSLSPEISLEKTIQRYLEKVATPDYSKSSLLKNIEDLNLKSISRIPISRCDTEARATANQVTISTNESNEVWIPPLLPSVTDGTKNSSGASADTNDATTMNVADENAEMRAQKKAFHRAIRIKYPFLQTESITHCHNDHKAPTLQSIDDNKRDRSTHHWIRVTVEECFDDLVQYLHSPRNDLTQLLLFRNRGFEGASPRSKSNNRTDVIAGTPSVTLQLRPGISKDDRRKVHHILATKNKHFESSVRHQGSKDRNSSKSVQSAKQDASENSPPEPVESAPIDLIVTWKKQALRKGVRKNNKRKRSDDGRGKTSNYNSNKNLLCVLKKINKEHLTAIQILTKKLRCRQADIGFAGIKDMQAITYQFITLRNTTVQRVQRDINRFLAPGKSNVELKILCSNVDFFLNVGGLEGNQFEIVVRNLKRIKLDRIEENACNGNGMIEPAKECFIECDNEHIDQMVERIREHGFINFYGEQRVGAPGDSNDVGVRAFEIGHSMLRQDFMGAIKLLMEGTRHHEQDDVARVRKAWKDSNGNPSITLKAFQRADIMPRERAVLRGLNRYPDNPLEAIRFLSYNMRTFYINAYQSLIFNRAASQRIKLYGDKVVKGDLYFEHNDNRRDSVKVVQGNEVPPIGISQVVLPLPGYNVRYPQHEIGELYRTLLEEDGVKFEKESVPEATAKGDYRKLIIRPGNLIANIDASDPSSKSMKLSFDLPKGCYATMLLRELMMTTVARSKN